MDNIFVRRATQIRRTDSIRTCLLVNLGGPMTAGRLFAVSQVLNSVYT